MIDKLELKPCPFCGENDTHLKYLGPHECRVECTCGATGSWATRGERAIEVWNRRHPCPECAAKKVKIHEYESPENEATREECGELSTEVARLKKENAELKAKLAHFGHQV